MHTKLDILKYYIIFPMIGAIILLNIVFCVTVLYPQDVFHSSYQSVIQDKYDTLVNTTEPKIILIGGSNLGFGLDEELLSEETGYPVVNLGLHAGYGGLFNTEIAKANIDEGDIVLLGYEYGWHKEEYFETFGVDLIMTGVDSKIEMYQYMPTDKYVQIIGYLPDFAKKKMNYTEASGTYSRSSFDQYGHMTLEREFRLQEYEDKVDVYNYVSLDDIEISEESVEYLTEFRDYVISKGATVYFIAPPLYEKAKESDDETFLELVALEEESIGIRYISNPLDYVFSDEYIYDTIYHCSTLGEKRRTEQLIEDLYNAGVVK